MRYTLRNGYVADFEDNGDRVTVYGPFVGGYRARILWAELTAYTPGWGNRADSITEWRLFDEPIPGRPRYLGSQPLFDSVPDLLAWLGSGL